MKAESGLHGTKTKTKGDMYNAGVITCIVETAISINHCLQKEDRGYGMKSKTCQ